MKQVKKTIFYGWIIVAGCMMIRLGLGITSYSMSVFLKPLCEALGVSRGAFSAYSTFSYVATMVMLPILSVWFKKYSFKKLLWLGAIVTSLVMFGYSYVTAVWQFYVLAAINGLFNGLLNSIPIAILMTNWFKEKRGFATGLAFTGSGISAMVVTPLSNYLIEQVSWQMAFKVCAIMYLVFMFIPLAFIIKEKPEDMGLVALGAEKEAESNAIRIVKGFTLAQAKKSVTFWTIGLCMFLTGFVYMGTQNHVIAYLTDIGHTSTFASAVYSIAMAFDTVGKIVLGALYDKIGIRKTNIYIYGLLFGLEILLLFAISPAIAIAVGVTMGMVVAVQTGTYPVVINTFMGDKDYTSIYGNLTVLYFGGMAIGVPFSGFVFDWLGSYQAAWIGYAIGAIVILALLIFVEKKSKEEMAVLGE